MKKVNAVKTIFIVLIFFLPGILSAQGVCRRADFSKGPLFGKNLFIPYLIHYTFPSLPARSGQRYDLQYHFSLYYVNDFHSIRRTSVIRDYESSVFEWGVRYNLYDELQLGVTMRIISFFGGFLDPIIEGFHNFFGLPNGNRAFVLHNQLFINIPNSNGIALYLDEPTTSFGDIDLWAKWTFWENRQISLALLGAFKIPTGRLSALSGSGYPDIGLGLLFDYRFLRHFTFYTQAGVVLPFNGKSYPMFNGLVAFEMHPFRRLSFILQMNIKTSPISDGFLYIIEGEPPIRLNHYSKPQTNILAGAILRHKNFSWQFYIEQDTIFHQGADITFNLMFSHTINLRNR